MQDAFFTLQDFYAHTKGVTYVLLVLILIGFAGFWRFLTERDDDELD